MRKAGPEEIINASINQTLSRTVLTSLTTLMVVLALFFFVRCGTGFFLSGLGYGNYLKLIKGDSASCSVIMFDHNELGQYLGVDDFTFSVVGFYSGVLFWQSFFQFGVGFVFVSEAALQSSTVAGGVWNVAGGDYSLAAGRQANIDIAHDGTFL